MNKSTDNNSMNTANEKQRRNKRFLIISLAVAVGMFGFAFALVPLYNVLCKVTGLNGKTDNFAVSYDASQGVDKTRKVTVLFLATNNENLPWEFRPVLSKTKLHPGEKIHLAYYAKNNSGHRMTVQAIPSVSPGAAAKYLHKTECFCFKQQTFNTDEARNMPLVFHVDKDLPKNVHTIILSYTLFDATPFAKQKPEKVGRIS